MQREQCVKERGEQKEEEKMEEGGRRVKEMERIL